MDYLTPQQRLEKICKILVRGIYVYAQKEGWIEKPDDASASNESSIQDAKKERPELPPARTQKHVNKHFEAKQKSEKR